MNLFLFLFIRNHFLLSTHLFLSFCILIHLCTLQFLVVNGLWKSILHKGILSYPRHMGLGLGSAPNDATDFEDSPWRPHLPWGAERQRDVGWEGDWEGGKGEITGIDM